MTRSTQRTLIQRAKQWVMSACVILRREGNTAPVADCNRQLALLTSCRATEKSAPLTEADIKAINIGCDLFAVRLNALQSVAGPGRVADCLRNAAHFARNWSRAHV